MEEQIRTQFARVIPYPEAWAEWIEIGHQLDKGLGWISFRIDPVV